jgi:hypothetical protein
MGAPDKKQSEIESRPEVVRREITIEASPEQVWESLISEEGRERWLGPDPGRKIYVEFAEDWGRLVWWWWWEGDEAPTRVEFLLIEDPLGAGVIVTESTPQFPLAMFASSFICVAA